MENSDEKPFHSSVDFRVLGKKIQKTRKAKGIRQAELADRLDISYQYMSMIASPFWSRLRTSSRFRRTISWPIFWRRYRRKNEKNMKTSTVGCLNQRANQCRIFN